MRYAIWDKTSDVITPIGEVFTAEQWKERYPVARLDRITVVCAAGEINGAFFGTLGNMVQMYADQGADFSEAVTDEEKLAVIEVFENDRNSAANAAPTAEERTAAALEFIAMSSLPDE